MNEKIERATSAVLMLAVFFLAGCTPGPPPPPIFPGFEWLVVGFIVLIAAILLWRRCSPKETSKTDYLTDAINAMSKRIEELEKKIDELNKKQNKKKNK